MSSLQPWIGKTKTKRKKEEALLSIVIYKLELFYLIQLLPINYDPKIIISEKK